MTKLTYYNKFGTSNEVVLRIFSDIFLLILDKN